MSSLAGSVHLPYQVLAKLLLNIPAQGITIGHNIYTCGTPGFIYSLSFIAIFWSVTCATAEIQNLLHSAVQ